MTKGFHDLENEEVNIISGALELRKKRVVDVMTHLEDIYMLSYDAALDFETISEIMRQGIALVLESTLLTVLITLSFCNLT